MHKLLFITTKLKKSYYLAPAIIYSNQVLPTIVFCFLNYTLAIGFSKYDNTK